VSWATEAIGAIRKMVLVEDRIERLAKQTDMLAMKCQELDMRLTRLETKSEMLEKLGPKGRRTRKKLEA
jgi:ubiquinone biosynthesis protein UbiJ